MVKSFGLLKTEQSFHEIQVGFVHNAVFVQLAFALLRFLGEDVTLERLLVSDLAGSGYLEPLLGTRVCFYLRHYTIFTFTPCWRSAPAETYGALWAIIPP